MHPHFEANGSFAGVKLGRKPVKKDGRTLRLANYLDETKLPRNPSAVGTPAVPGWPMYGNDEFGDCTLASAAHMVEGWSFPTGLDKTPDSALVVEDYWLTGHPPAKTGVAGGPTDDGRVELDVLNFWRKTGVAGDKILAYVSVDPRSETHVKTAIHLFGGVYTGICLPLSAQSQGHLWDVVGDGKTGPSAPCSWGGHAVPYLGYDVHGPKLITWGYEMAATWAFHLRYCEEAYAIISPDWFRNGHTISGFDLATLQNDLKAIASH